MCNATSPVVVELARRLRSHGGHGPHALRKGLEVIMLPMVRCALRDGVGQPTLVNWVRNQLSLLDPRGGGDPDPVRYTVPIFNVLCDQLIEQIDPLSGRETVAC